MTAELTHGAHKTDHIVPSQHAQNLIARHGGQLVDAVPVHFSKSICQLCLRPYPFRLRR